MIRDVNTWQNPSTVKDEVIAQKKFKWGNEEQKLALILTGSHTTTN